MTDGAPVFELPSVARPVVMADWFAAVCTGHFPAAFSIVTNLRLQEVHRRLRMMLSVLRLVPSTRRVAAPHFGHVKPELLGRVILSPVLSACP
ncbi:MAG: hypothetical protein WC736_15375 [Gallionella sp.]